MAVDHRLTDDTDERTRSPGAVYTQVRTSNTGATRPFTEMQSDNVASPHRTDMYDATPGQHDDQQQPDSSRQERHASGVDGSLLTELLGHTL